jgi:hypothetical protein
MQVLGGVAGGGSLSGVPLCLTQVSNVLHERGEARDQRDLREGWVAADGRGGGKQPSCAAQAVPGRGGARDAPVGGAVRSWPLAAGRLSQGRTGRGTLTCSTL